MRHAPPIDLLFVGSKTTLSFHSLPPNGRCNMETLHRLYFHASGKLVGGAAPLVNDNMGLLYRLP
jgi:hypothetical protein